MPKKQKMKEVTIINQITENCPLGCKYCYLKCNKNNKSSYQSLETLENIINLFSKNYEAIILVWHGGEPLLRGLDYYKKAHEIIKKFEGKVKIKQVMQTSGTPVISKEHLDFLIDKMNISIGITMDGDEEIQNNVRPKKDGSGSFDNAIKTIDLLKNKGIGIGVICVMSAANINHAKRIYDFFKSKGVGYLSVRPFVDTMHDPSLAITNRQLFQFYKELFEAWAEDKSPERIKVVEPLSRYVDFFKYKNSARYTCKNSCLGNTFSIKFDGTISPCAELWGPEFELGNVNKINSVKEIYNSTKYKKLMEKMIKNYDKNCFDCNLYMVCKGGCRSSTKVSTGKYEEKYVYCEGTANLIKFIAENWRRCEGDKENNEQSLNLQKAIEIR